MVKAYYKKVYVMQLNQDQAHNLVTRGGAVWDGIVQTTRKSQYTRWSVDVKGPNKGVSGVSSWQLRLQLPWKKFHRALYEGTNPSQVEGPDGKVRPGHWEEEVKYMVDEEPPEALTMKEIKVFLKEILSLGGLEI